LPGECPFRQFAEVIDAADGADGIMAQMRTDRQWLGICVADAADPHIALDFGNFGVEFGPELDIFDIMDRPLEATAAPEGQSPTTGSQM